MKKIRKDFRPYRMVNWFTPKMLFNTGIKALISGIFGNYADRREMQAALAGKETGDIPQDYCKVTDSFWLDFVSDTGDGFNATYSIAKLIAEEELTVMDRGEETKLPRAQVVIFGGDQIYPTPSRELYENKFKIPLALALPTDAVKKGKEPHLYAIPGNHDWYDGLGNFIKIFCQQRSIGAWQTKQDRSYFAFPLPGNYWIWATDIQLNADIDQPQLDYFVWVGKQMKEQDKIILITAEPAWVYQYLNKKDESYDRLTYFIQTYITDNSQCINKPFQLAAVLTGDLHHYAHYQSNEAGALSPHYIGAGGGGAFLHLTHNLPETLVCVHHTITSPTAQEKKVIYEQAKVFPSPATSRKLLMGNLMFFCLNRPFCLMMGLIYFFLYWMLQASATGNAAFAEMVHDGAFSEIFADMLWVLKSSPWVSLPAILLIAGIYQFADAKRGKRATLIAGGLHAIVQGCLPFLVFWLVRRFAFCSMEQWHPLLRQALVFLEIVALGFIMSGFVMGIYLLLSNLLAKMHIDEASSSLSSPHYKNFLRLHFHQGKVTVYPIGIKQVTTSWKQSSQTPLQYSGPLPEYALIEDSFTLGEP